MNQDLTSDDRELVQQLLDDVGLLEARFILGIPKPAETRAHFTPILRRWIVEGLFHQAQKLILRNGAVGFPIVSNAHAIKLCKAGVYEHWMGVVYFGTVGVATAKVAQKYLASDGKPTTQLNDSSTHTQPSPQPAKLFFDQRMFFWKQQFYTRADVIKMLANTLGGVHLNFKKSQDEAHIKEIKNYFGFELKGNNYQMLVGEQIGLARADPIRRQQVYDATELIAMDTARIFASGVRASAKLFIALQS
jgi:hypothetical protein